MNIVHITGTVPSFENSGRSFNIEDETKARFSGTLNVRGFGKDDNGKPKDDPIEFVAFGKRAQFLASHWTKGQGWEMTGRLTPSRKRTNADGSAVMTAEGKQVWSGIGLTVYDADFARNYAQKGDTTTATAGAPAQATADPFATGAPAGGADPFGAAAPAADPFGADPFGASF